MVKNDFNFKLKSEVKYTGKDGSVLTAGFIRLCAPTVRSLSVVAPIKQTFMRCIMDTTNGISKEELERISNAPIPDEPVSKKDMEGGMIITMVTANPNISYEKFLTDFIAILKTPSIAQIEGEMPIKDSFLDQLPLSELEGMVGEYIANFIAPSV